ncbi:hypothetical protein THOM_2830, partial [Trachipleistophora hominis]
VSIGTGITEVVPTHLRCVVASASCFNDTSRIRAIVFLYFLGEGGGAANSKPASI